MAASTTRGSLLPTLRSVARFAGAGPSAPQYPPSITSGAIFSAQCWSGNNKIALSSTTSCLARRHLSSHAGAGGTATNVGDLGGDTLTAASVSPDSSARRRRRRRRLDVAIVGAPNAGKSQLLNALVQSPVAAVSRKRHTTRSGVLGARTINDTQLVFVDTPGFMRHTDVRGEGGMGKEVRNLARAAEAGLEGADYTLIVVDAAKRIDDSVREALVRLMICAAGSNGRKEEGVADFYWEGNNADDPLEEGESGVRDDDVRRPPLLVVDDSDDAEIVTVGEKFAIVLNKVDLVNPKKKLLEIAEDLGNMGDECVRYVQGVSAVAPQDDGEDDDDDDFEKGFDRVFDVANPPEDPNAVTVDSSANDGKRKDNVGTATESGVGDGGQENDDDADRDPHAGLDDSTIAILEVLYPRVFYVSARFDESDDPTAPGVSEVLKHLLARSTPSSEWPIEPGKSSDMTALERAEEIIREKIYRCLHREVPHRVEQVNRVFRQAVHPQTKRRALRIDQDLVVRTKSHQKLVMGRGGMVLRRMEDDAKRDLEKAFGCGVALNLHVKLIRSKGSGKVGRESAGVTGASMERRGVVRRDF